MVRRKGNPFADLERRLPHRTYIRREGPWCSDDRDELLPSEGRGREFESRRVRQLAY